MIRSRYLSTLALAALLGAAPAFAQTSATSTNNAESKPTAKMNETNATSTAARSDTTATTTTPLCSELKHPNAGKLADKSTGQAKERSASPVHQDCIPDATTSSNTTSSSTSLNSMDSTGTFSVNSAQNVNPNVGVDAKVGIGNTDINATTSQGATTDQTSTTR